MDDEISPLRLESVPSCIHIKELTTQKKTICFSLKFLFRPLHNKMRGWEFL